MNIYIHTLGCKVNQYESQALETLLSEKGHTVSETAADCDVIIVNTCAVTAESVRKSRQAVRRLSSESPNALVAVCGCWAQTAPRSPEAVGADVIYGSGDRGKMLSDIERAYAEKIKISNVDDSMKRRTFEFLPAGSSGTRTRALLKIEDGCVNFCAYCIIPYARGPVRSLEMSKAVDEAKKLADAGYREIVITGIEIASYGRDLKDGSSLTDVVCAIAEAVPNVRIRLGSLEPRVITEDLCRRLSCFSNICPHFHLSLQSGCDETLKRMKRKYDTSRFYASVELLRKYFPGCALTADLIAGFPGETEEEFSATLAFIEKCRFFSMHIFPYSIREGTAAASMPGQVAKAEKHARVKRASAVAERCKNEYLTSLIGSRQPVLLEQRSGEFWEGHAPNYANVRVFCENSKNTVVNVQITDVKNGTLLGNVTL